jgi:septum site-determining protein MinD
MDAAVVDADLAMADLPRGRGPDLHDVLAGRADPLEAVQGGGHVALVPCGRTLAGARAADPRNLGDAVAAIADEYGAVVLDAPAGMAADAGLALHVADRSVLVATPVASAVAGALRTRGLARELDAGVAAVALNRCGDDPPVSAVREALGAPVTPIPESDRVVVARRAGRPVSGDHPAACRVRELAATVRRTARGHSGRS